MEQQFIFEPDTQHLWTWLSLALIVLVVCIIIMIKTGKKGSKQKASPLIFLLTGMVFLVSLTIFCWMGFNISTTKKVMLDKSQIQIGENILNLVDLRKSFIHREGSGIPFKGLGASQGTDNSLILEWQGGKTIILSEDLYPIIEIEKAIKKFKKTE